MAFPGWSDCSTLPAGIVFAKFTKPTHRGKTIVFSRAALVTMRNGVFYLLTRVGDLRPTHLIESHVSAYMVRKSRTEEGETIPHHLFAIGFGIDLDGSQDFFQIYWPMVLSHRFVLSGLELHYVGHQLG